MKIYNIKGKSIFFIMFLIVLLLVLLSIAAYIINSSTIVMTNENYTQILKECHDDPYKYEGKRVLADGYIFRANDFSKMQFVTARDMLVNEKEARIVGFLCESTYASNFEDNEWVSIQGTIYVGDYYGAMPIVKVNDIKKITTPNDTFVYPPTV